MRVGLHVFLYFTVAHIWQYNYSLKNFSSETFWIEMYNEAHDVSGAEYFYGV